MHHEENDSPSLSSPLLLPRHVCFLFYCILVQLSLSCLFICLFGGIHHVWTFPGQRSNLSLNLPTAVAILHPPPASQWELQAGDFQLGALHLSPVSLLSKFWVPWTRGLLLPGWPLCSFQSSKPSIFSPLPSSLLLLFTVGE